MFSKEDIKQITDHGLSLETVNEQVEMFRKGFPWARIISGVKAGDGVKVIGDDFRAKLSDYASSAKYDGYSVFVPSSVDNVCASDTIAVNVENKPFRTEMDSLLFCSSGTGAMLQSLAESGAELVLVRPTVNGCDDSFDDVLSGYVLKVRDRIRDLATSLRERADGEMCSVVEKFYEEELSVKLPVIEDLSERVSFLAGKLERPLRVVSLLKNIGDRKCVPFKVFEKDGSISVQLVDTLRVNTTDPDVCSALLDSEYSSPAVMACCLKDSSGNFFRLPEFVDAEAGMIGSGSYDGRELKTLSLPGLWTGSMHHWNTIFVEHPY